MSAPDRSNDELCVWLTVGDIENLQFALGVLADTQNGSERERAMFADLWSHIEHAKTRFLENTPPAAAPKRKRKD
jgi:hypothetical protein